MSNILKLVAEFYQRNLSDEKAIDYLTTAGITSQDAIKAFHVGYATGGLTKLMTPDQAGQVIQAGLADNIGRNRFKSSMTFPLTDAEGVIVDICGLNLGVNGTIKCIGEHAKGCGNWVCLKATQEVFVTEYPMEALKLYQAGHRNVILCPDIHSASLIKCQKATVLSYKQPEALANVIQAEEVWCGYIYAKTKSPIESLKRIKCLKMPPVPIPTQPAIGEDILDKVVADLDLLGYVGEASNKKLAYLVAISRKLARPLSAIIISSSGAGKTGLMRAVANLVPDEEKLFLSRLTPQALYHMPKDALMEKLIVVDERNGSSMADYSIRTMQTSNVLTMAKPKSKDAQDGIKSINVKCAYMESTTSENINPENASRCFILHLDESPHATETVLKAQRLARSGNGKLGGEEVIKWHHEHQRGLNSLPVAIPFVHLLTFPSHKVTYRREQEKFLSLIEASALLHQHQRVIRNKTIEADVEDYRIAHELFLDIFKDMSREVSRNALSLLGLLEQERIVSFCIRDLLSLTGWTYATIDRTLKELVRYEYISQDHNKNGKKRIYTRLDYSIYGQSIGRLLPPHELCKTFARPSQQLLKTSVDMKDPEIKDIPVTFANQQASL